MEYTEVRWKVNAEQSDILVALLDAEGYEMFEEVEGGLKAFLPTPQFHRDDLDRLLSEHSILMGASYSVHSVEDKNWNAEWEKNYPPVFVGGRVYVRSSFHPPRPDAEFEIRIDPKMSFGTGHHDTTSLMLQMMLHVDLKNRVVLDMGCGTGILAIFASLRGAASVDAIDTDEWACRNANENCIENGISNVRVIQGDLHSVPLAAYDIILANINRNVILTDLGGYSSLLSPGGHLLLSGFLHADESIINETASRFHLRDSPAGRTGTWSGLHFVKPLLSER